MQSQMLGDTAATPPWMAIHPLTHDDSLAARAPYDDIMERVAAPAHVTFEAARTVTGIRDFDAARKPLDAIGEFLTERLS
jgi:hypothetical protein